MRSNFERALKLVLVHEGGWADHPKDPGGATMKGVTLKTYRSYFPNATKADLRKITDAQLAMIYRKGYWDKLGCDNLASGVDYAVFDFGVNSGPVRARTHLMKAIGGSDAETINRLCDSRLKFLSGLKTWGTFGKGWTSRVDGVRKEALAMAGKPADAQKPAPAPSATPKPERTPAPVPASRTGLIAFLAAAALAGLAAIAEGMGWI